MIVLYKGVRQSWGGMYDRLASRIQPFHGRVTLICDPGESELSSRTRDVQVLIPTSAKIDESVLNRMPNLRLIQQAGAGLELIDLDAARARGIEIANVPTGDSGASHAVAEHAVGLILALTRGYNEFASSIRERKVGLPIKHSLRGKIVGIIGFGSIGRQIARLLEPFQVSILALTKSGLANFDRSNVLWVKPTTQLHELLQEADIIVLACPLSPLTDKILNREALRKCKRGIYIVNIARGPLLETAAALEGLNNGSIAGLGMDVFDREPVDPEDPLVLHPHVIASPHIAAATEEVAEKVADVMADNIVRVLENRPCRYTVQ